jgi:hypothetical protein
MRFLLLLLTLMPLSVLPLSAADRDDVIATVQKTFDAMAAHDGSTLAALFTKDARVVAIRESGESSSTAATDFATRLSTMTAKILERMWNPEVKISGRLASLWAPYDFHRDGKRTHCGIDQVDLVKTPDGWRIATIIYTVVTTDCPVSPLGPVQ